MKKGLKWLILVSLVVVFAGVVWMTNRPVPPANAPKSSEQNISVSPLTGYRVPPFFSAKFSR